MSLETSTRTRGTSQILCRFAGGPGGIAGRLAKKIDESQLWACRMLSVSLAALSSAFARIVAGTNMWLGHGMNFYGRAIGFVFLSIPPLVLFGFYGFGGFGGFFAFFGFVGFVGFLALLASLVLLASLALFWLCSGFVLTLLVFWLCLLRWLLRAF